MSIDIPLVPLLVLGAKVGFFCLSLLLTALFCLWPINDQPTSKLQFVVWIAINTIVLAVITGLIEINFT